MALILRFTRSSVIGSPPKTQKPPKGQMTLWKLYFPSLLETFFHRELQKVYPVKSADGGYCEAGI
jgi:hypothetical protein